MTRSVRPADTRVNVLLVDDHPANLIALEAILEPLGQNLVKASSGEEALKHVLRDDFAVILLDVQMSGMDGFETATLIKQREKSRSIPIIFVTAISKAERNVFQGYEAGAVDYIFKPFDPDILKSKVAVFVDLYKKGQEINRQSELLRKKNAQMEAELQTAREIQQAFLPQQYPTLPPAVTSRESALHFFARYIPTTTLGGDFYDVLALSECEIGVFICDVMGHGVRSALVTAMIHTLVEELRPVANDPGHFLTEVNRDLQAILKRMRTPLFASALYLVADVARGEMRYANAGHPSPLHLRRDAGIAEPLQFDDGMFGPALGVLEEFVYPTCSRPLAVQDVIVLFTDGLYEVEGIDEAYDEERLVAAVRQRINLPTPDLFTELLDEIRQFSANGEFEDDVCLVGMEVCRLGLPRASTSKARSSKKSGTRKPKSTSTDQK